LSTGDITSFLKWPGGKRWLTTRFSDLFPDHYCSYFEPFVGSGSVFFSLRPDRGQISDANGELINLYQALRKAPAEVWRALRTHANRHSDSYYYQVRSSKPRSAIGQAARMLYLNRTCWNGLYRVNQRGEFNVPRGTKNKVLLDDDDFGAIASALRRIRIKCCDFEEAIDVANRDDFLFLERFKSSLSNFGCFLRKGTRCSFK
jgi:DNA adenine methylase